MTMKPPRLATWILESLVDGPHRDGLIGDLHEQFAEGRSAAWYWRQTILAVAHRVACDVKEERFLALRGLFAGWTVLIAWSYAVTRSYAAVAWAYRVRLRHWPSSSLWLMFGAFDLTPLCIGAAVAGWL